MAVPVFAVLMTTELSTGYRPVDGTTEDASCR